MSVIWYKFWSDLWDNKARTLLAVLSISAGVFDIGAMFGMSDQMLAGMDGLKRYLLTDRQDQFARAIVHKMTAYALGRPLSFGDHADIDELTARLRRKEDRLGDLVHLIVSSDIFNTK